jgi:hypothetical protein
VSIARRLKDAIPDEYAEILKNRYRDLAMPLARRRWRGDARYCSLCESRVREFRPAGIVARANARCPVCGSLERHRLLWLYLTERTDLFDSRHKKLLHVSPEYVIANQLRGIANIDYLSCDLESKQAMVQMDIRAINLPDATFDVVICNHVMEHIPEDRRAMAELYRVLKPGGWAILQTPIAGDTTHEVPTVQTPTDRLRHFGQRDHVRVYGRDYGDRLSSAGFDVHVDDYVRTLNSAVVVSYGLDVNEDVYFCRKPV